MPNRQPVNQIVSTKLSKYTYSNELPSGVNAIVAIMTHTGFNQEDSVMINKSALDRGLFTSTYYKIIRDQCTKNHSSSEEEVFTNPKSMCSVKNLSYDKLEEDEIIFNMAIVDTPIVEQSVEHACQWGTYELYKTYRCTKIR